jgi:flagellar assembly factor FliW
MTTNYAPERAQETMTEDIRAIEFEEGIPGFPDVTRFVLLDIVEDGAFQTFQSVDDPAVGFIVAVPWLFFPDYAPVLTDVDQQGLDIERQEDAVVFCPVTVDAEASTAYMNLVGPFVVNIRTMRGRQIVLTDQELPLRAELPLSLS